jgi:hypothetical protein
LFGGQGQTNGQCHDGRLGGGGVLVDLKDCFVREMEATRSSETSVYNNPHGTTSQKTACFIVTGVKTSNPEWEKMRNKRVENNPQ